MACSAAHADEVGELRGEHAGAVARLTERVPRASEPFRIEAERARNEHRAGGEHEHDEDHDEHDHARQNSVPARLPRQQVSQLHDRGREQLPRGERGIEHAHALRIGYGEAAVRRVDPREEGVVLELDAVGSAPPRRVRPTAGSITSSSVRSGRRPPVANSFSRAISCTPSSRPAPW